MPVLTQNEGPTVDANRELATPVYRREPFQLDCGGPVPISLKDRPRPVTHRMDHTLQAGRTRVMTRQSNINPDNAGGDALTGVWGLNDPDALAQDQVAVGGGRGGMMVMLGVVLGAGAYFLSRKR